MQPSPIPITMPWFRIFECRHEPLTEKPLALSVEAGEMLADLADKNKVTHMVGYHKRSDPAMEYAKSIIDQWKEQGIRKNALYPHHHASGRLD